MDIATLQAYGYFFLTGFLVVVLYAYIYHLYTRRKSNAGIDYEEYSNIALDDDISATPIEKNEKREVQ
ncbi:MAG: cytochrome c oxidase, cbb3-type, CcoQ subunit [Helicobacteraceae bacterium]|nr:cytochrome c oxidase, cbb3-type, CcoQ subunit [Helicobacteraceae bacterium]